METSVTWAALDNDDFDAIAFVNSIFPSEESLSEIDKVSRALREKISQLDSEMSEAVRKQSLSRSKGKEQLERAHTAIDDLRQKIQDIKTKSEESETMVQSICVEISQLDFEKKSLANSISAFKKLQMLVTGLEVFRELVEKQQYEDLPEQLKQMKSLISFFKQFRIPQITALVDDSTDVLRQLERNIVGSIRSVRDWDEITEESEEKRMRGAFNCATLLGESTRMDITNSLCEDLLRSYGKDYLTGGSKNDLRHVPERYVWLKKTIRVVDRHKAVFPPLWCIPAHLAWEFCQKTKKDLDLVLHRAGGPDGSDGRGGGGDGAGLDIAVLVKVLLTTLEFEEDLDIYMKSILIQLESDEDNQGFDDDDEMNDEGEEDSDEGSFSDDDDGHFAALAGKSRFRRKKKKKDSRKGKEGKEKRKGRGSGDEEEEAENKWKNRMEQARVMVKLDAMRDGGGGMGGGGAGGEEENEEEESEDSIDMNAPATTAEQVRRKYQKRKEKALMQQRKKEMEEKRLARLARTERAKKAGEQVIEPFAPSFKGVLSSSFLPYLNLFVQQEDKELMQLVTEVSSSSETAKDEEGTVLASAAKLFKRIKTSYSRTKSLSREKTMSDISLVFMLHLCSYLDNIYAKYPRAIQRLLQTTTSNSASSASVSSAGPILMPYQHDLVKLTEEEEELTCVIINTGMYCYETTEQLIQTIAKNIQPQFAEMLNATAPLDKASKIISVGQEGLAYFCLSAVDDLIATIPSVISKLTDSSAAASSSGASSSASSESPFVHQLAQLLPVVFAKSAATLYDLRWRRFLGVFVGHFINRLVQILSKIKKLNQVSVSQVMVDLENIQSILINLPDSLGKSADLAYKAKIREGFSKTKTTYQLVTTPTDCLVQTFLAYFPDGTKDTLTRICELKQLKREERQMIFDQFAEMKKT
ncbi:Vps53A, component of GARP and EARP complexes [Monocercomonoides exilis]|uniref:Vps53A, component of GARP and EARP complexes n=1 Tax=Monocercomonoides exilis TaxID=2049356 RepID=UPI00355AB505|nr:Vps53A, component of GARP and EARP complexes [Monocercomonoides exilis]|eukprot:MONOS_5676.1-p1 / transcript=MONOS_5676.1 / gene=MONOS_5676 / organism=Monocercomonoides_exilis_PA203 / gene_product=Vps53A, component of GARP (Golgi-associated retrograde protein) and EARP (endosome-associated recycling protein) complexes / transcript_product=Vps53A, component of GARP (Golgi-associated retrograde protein) and EARP (endosome-associated recycling protein) complexes / location=Mono_scaffold00168:28368-32280(-) / protein_length=925 / sequence_SO=supercontig / SO=protein_coding / is